MHSLETLNRLNGVATANAIAARAAETARRKALHITVDPNILHPATELDIAEREADVEEQLEDLQEALEDARAEARQEGWDEGHTEGYESGIEEGREQGAEDGWESGWEQGHEDGKADAEEEADERVDEAGGPYPIVEFLRRAGIDSLDPVTVQYDAAINALVWTQGPYIFTQSA